MQVIENLVRDVYRQKVHVRVLELIQDCGAVPAQVGVVPQYLHTNT